MSSPFASRLLPDLGRYNALGLLGEGDSGRLYLAEDQVTRIQIAMRLLHPPKAQEEDEVLLHTANSLSAVRQAHLAEILECGRLSDGTLFVAMEYAVGRVLGDVLGESKGLPAARAVAIARQLCDALNAIHDAGLVYLELNANNVNLGGSADAQEPQVKLLNIDMAMVIGHTCLRSNGNDSEPNWKRAAYWSPEQRSGVSVDVRSDIYSLGVLLYEMLSGELPFGTHAESDIGSATAQGRASDLGSADGTLPKHLTDIVKRCMAKKPQDRFASASQLEEALSCFDDEVATGSPSTPSPPLAPASNVSISNSLALEAQQSEPLPPGTLVGTYRLLKLLGQGGMGFVYQAQHTRINRVVAIKMLRPEFADTQQAVERFFSEAKAANQIAHENIVEITDFVENERGNNYVIMELLKGMELSEALDGGALVLGRCLRIAVQMCEALGAVHSAGIIHRDLKPDNIFLTKRAGQSDFVKILDFGIAKLTDTEGLSTNHTAAGAVFGTPEYMSPEQAMGHEVDNRCDIYSFGVILFEMVTGTKLFEAETFAEVLVMHMKAPPPKPSSVTDLPLPIPLGLEELILECLEKDPDCRPRKMEVVAERLRQIAESDGALLESFVSDDHFSEDSYGGLPIEISRKGKGKWIATVAGVALLAAGVAFLMTQSDSTAETSQKEVEVAAQTKANESAVQDPENEPVEVAPTPPELTTVEVAFASTPAGAEVFRAGSDEPLGKTPFTASLEHSSEIVPFDFRLEGHDSVSKSVALSADTEVKATLVTVTEVNAKRSGKKFVRRKGVGRKGAGRKGSGRKGTGKKGTNIKRGGIKKDLFGKKSDPGGT